MITKSSIEQELNRLYPSRKANLFKDRADAVSIVETIMAQGFMDAVKFFMENTNKPSK